MMSREHPIRIRTRLKISKGIPDLVPFVGVFFLLLIFFMIGSSFVQVSGIHVDLPKVSGSSSYGAKKIVVTVDRSGKIYFNDIVLNDMNELKAKLLSVKPASSERTTILLRSDRTAEFGIVARIMALAEDLNINVFLLTAPPAPQSRAKGDSE